MLVKGAHYKSLTIYREQWRNLYATVVKLYRWADEARRDGILSLEDQAGREENEFLAAHLQDICDGTSPELLMRKMKLWSAADILSNFDRIARAIEIEGLAAIQSGDNPRRFASFIVAYIPGKLRGRFEKRLSRYLDADWPDSAKQIKELFSSEEPPSFVHRTIRQYLSLRRGVKYQAIRSSDAQVLAGVLFDAPRKFQTVVLHRLPLRRIEIISNLMQSYGIERLQKIQKASHLIFRTEMDRWEVQLKT